MIGRRLIVAVAASLVVGTLVATVPAAVGKAMPQVKLPAKLRLLERRMRSLSIKSERYEVRTLVRGPGVTSKHPFRHLLSRLRRGRRSAGPRLRTRTVLVLSAVVEVSRSPFIAIARGHEVDSGQTETIQTGQELFRRRPEAARIDGGRPWVLANLSKPENEGIQGLTGYAGNDGRRSLIGRLVEDFAEATSAVEVGPAVVLGRQTAEFLLVRSNGHRRLTRSVRVFFESNGLPVRIEWLFSLGGRKVLIDKIDVLATEIPVSVQPPPPSETISEAELLKIEWPVVKGPGPGIPHQSRPRPKK